MCYESSKDLRLFLDGRLTPERQHEMTRHLTYCNQCLSTIKHMIEVKYRSSGVERESA